VTFTLIKKLRKDPRKINMRKDLRMMKMRKDPMMMRMRKDLRKMCRKRCLLTELSMCSQ
jgi:hypothetical protein